MLSLFVSCSSFSENEKRINISPKTDSTNRLSDRAIDKCILIGVVKDSSETNSFSDLEKENLGRTSIYGHLAPLRFKDIELSVVDKSLAKYDPLDIVQVLKELTCDFYISGEILKFSNKFFLTYSITEIVFRLDLYDKRGKRIWSKTEERNSDAGAIPFTPIGALTGIFFAAKNRKEEIAVQLLDSVSRRLIKQLVQYLDETEIRSTGVDPLLIENKISYSFNVSDLRKAIRVRDFSEAEVIAEKLLRDDPKNSEILFLSGQIYLSRGQFNVAKKFFLEAIKIDSKKSDYFNGLGITNLRLGRNSNAFSNFERAIELNQKNVSAYLGLALLAENKGLIETAGGYIYSAGLYSVSSGDYTSSVYLLSELKRLSLEKQNLSEKVSGLEAVIKFNRGLLQ